MEIPFNNEIIRTDSSKYLLDDDFVKVFEPFRNLQKILGCSRVDVKDRFVRAPTISQKCYTVVCIIMMSISIGSLLKTYYIRFVRETFMFYLWMGGISGGVLVFSISILYGRFYNNNGNVEFYLKMQKIDRVMKTNVNINRIHYRQNLKIVAALVVVFVTLLVVALVLVREEFGIFELVIATYILQSFVVELCSCSCHIVFFYGRIRMVNSIIINHFKRGDCVVEVLSKQSTLVDVDYFTKIPAVFQNFETSATDLYIKEIFDGFSCFQDQYKFQIALFCLTFVTWILFTFEYGIFTLQKSNINKRFLLVDYLLLLSLALLELIILLVLCVRSEAFFREVNRTKQLSTLVMSRYIDGPLRKRAKNMLRLIQETPPCFSVYGMWNMDARLLLDIFNIITSLVVTIMQFTFL